MAKRIRQAKRRREHKRRTCVKYKNRFYNNIAEDKPCSALFAYKEAGGWRDCAWKARVKPQAVAAYRACAIARPAFAKRLASQAGLKIG